MAQKKATSTLKNSWHIIFSFIPLLNSITFFIMSMNPKIKSRAKIKKWKIIAWVLVIVNVILPIPGFVQNPVEIDVSEQPDKPYVSEYLGENYHLIENYKTLPEYKEYELAYEQYEKDYQEWKNRPDIAEAFEESENWNNIFDAFELIFLIFNLVMLFVAISENGAYINLLRQEEKKDDIYNAIGSGRDITQKQTTENYQNQSKDEQTKPEIKKSEQVPLNINIASAEEIAELPGLTIIEGQKAVKYREENGEFKNVDEFFDLLKLKPHVLVNLESIIFAESINKALSETIGSGGAKRRIDL